MREEGYYWVKHQGNWEIAKWYQYVGGKFEWDFFTEMRINKSKVVFPDLDEIDQRRIERTLTRVK